MELAIRKLKTQKAVKYVYLIFVLLVITVGLGLYILYQQGIEKIIIEETQKRQELAAKSGSLYIETVIEDIAFNLKQSSLIPDIYNHNPNGHKLLDQVISEIKENSVRGLGIIDKNGIMLHVSNRKNTNVEKTDVSDRAYFIWAKNPINKDRYFVSNPFISKAGITKDEPVIAVSFPIYAQNKFNGTLIGVISLQDFSSNTLSNYSVYKTGDVCITNTNGEIIASTDPKKKDHVLPTELISENKETITYLEEGSEDQIITIQKLKIADSDYFLIVSNPKKEIVKGYLGSLLNINSVTIIFIIGAALIGAFLTILIEIFAYKNGYESGYRKTKDKKH